MNGKFILLSGSAGRSCPTHKLDIAHQFIRSFTREVLRRGGSIVVLAGDEESTKNERGEPHIFDWVALREVERHANSTSESSRPYVRIVMSDEAPKSKIGDPNLRVLRNLQQRNVVEICRLRRDVFTGGTYRTAMAERSDAMLAIGGGKGTYSAGSEMIELGKPVLPLDLQLDSTVGGDGGAALLHKEMTTDPTRFFPNTHPDVANRVELLSLDHGINDAEDVARVSVEILASEIDSTALSERRTNVKGRLDTVWQFAKALPIVASAIKVIEWLRGFLLFM